MTLADELAAAPSPTIYSMGQALGGACLRPSECFSFDSVPCLCFSQALSFLRADISCHCIPSTFLRTFLQLMSS